MPPDQPRLNVLLIAMTVLLVTLTLRVPTAAVGPAVPAIGMETGFPPPILALLTSVPLLCFLVIAPFAPALQSLLGLRSLLLWSLMLASVGTAIRSIPGTVLLAAGTVLLGLAVAVASVIAPALIKEVSTSRSGWVVALYTASLSLGPAMAAGLTVPLGNVLGQTWRTGLAVWAILPFLAAVCWFFLAPRAHRPAESGSDPISVVKSVQLRDVMREPSAWRATFYLALTSLLFYSLIAWLPTILESDGLSPAAAGATAALTSLVAIPASLSAPWMVRRMRTARFPPLLAPLPFALGAVLLALAPQTVIAAVFLMGIGQGASVGVAYSLILTTTRSTSHATALSALSQTVGVTLAALGPVGLAAVQVAAGDWAPALGLLAVIAAGQALLGVVVPRSSSTSRRLS